MSVKEAAQCAAEAVVALTEFKNPAIKQDWGVFIVNGLGTLRWRRVLSPESVHAVYDVIKRNDDDESTDESGVEWISAPMTAFFMQFTKDQLSALCAESARVVALGNCLSMTEDAAALDLLEDTIRSTFEEYPVSLFCFLLYHSGLQYKL